MIFESISLSLKNFHARFGLKGRSYGRLLWPMVCLFIFTFLSGSIAAAGRPKCRLIRPKTRQVTTLTINTRACKGNTHRAVVRISPSRGRDFRVGFFEELAVAMDPQWRAAAWMAATVACLYSGRPMVGMSLSFDRAGFPKGTSAGGLLTSALLSAFYNRPLRPKVTMTGAIFPDGSIGPVGGIYQKLRAAKGAGLTKVLIPAGTAGQRDGCGRQPGTAFELGRRMGIEVVEVTDVFLAYAHLTGQRPVKADDQKITLPPKAVISIKKSYQRWRRLFDARMAAFGSMGRRIPSSRRPFLARLWSKAHQSNSRAKNLYQAEKYAAALAYTWRAATLAEQGLHVSALAPAHKQGGLQAMKRVFSRLVAGSKTLDPYLKMIQNRPVKTLGGLSALVEAYRLFNVSLGRWRRLGRIIDSINRAKTPSNALLLTMTRAVMLEVRVRHTLMRITDVLNMGMGHGPAALPGLRQLRDWAITYELAALAALTYIDHVVIGDLAKTKKVSATAIRRDLAHRDRFFGLAVRTLDARRKFRPTFGGGLHGDAASLGASVGSYASAALVVVKQLGLYAGYDKWGDLVRLKRADRLPALLGSARSRLRREILGLKTKGVVPVIAVFGLDVAGAMASPESGLQDRVTALYHLYAGWLQARLMSVLARSTL